MKKSYVKLVALTALLVLFFVPYEISAKKRVKEEAKPGGIKVALDIMTVMEHHKMMKMMKMEMKKMKMDSDATHHLSVTLIDESTGKGIKEAKAHVSCLSQEGKEVENTYLMFMSKMGHFGGEITLGRGKFYIKVTITLKDGFKYTTTFPFIVP